MWNHAMGWIHWLVLPGQELNGTTWSLCKMNMLFHDIYDAQILNGDIADPQHIDQGRIDAL